MEEARPLELPPSDAQQHWLRLPPSPWQRLLLWQRLLPWPRLHVLPLRSQQPPLSQHRANPHRHLLLCLRHPSPQNQSRRHPLNLLSQ